MSSNVVAVEGLEQTECLRTTPRFRWHPTAVFGLVVFGIILGVTIFAAWLAPYDPTHQDILHRLKLPYWEHPFGTDALGRDVLTRIFYGGQQVRPAVNAALLLTGVPALSVTVTVKL